MPIRGAIFDLDGTLVDSGLDFDQMRREMGIAGGMPLLEALENLPPETAAACWAILDRHELRGSERATLFPGVREFLSALDERGVVRAVVTRNGRAIARATLDRLGLEFNPIICREDAPPKPDPGAIWKVCETWGFNPSQCVVIGDYRFDIEAGQRAGTHTVLFTAGGERTGLGDGEPADFVLESFAEPGGLWAWWAQIDLGGSGGSC
ncbi:MAG TPA: HAD family hydrolase [Pirellulales bacterium]|jgi:HAD superfamily hydrolase (TIGR01509 family)|nr:HAD family hydrolase [Pirellulales bacterium]